MLDFLPIAKDDFDENAVDLPLSEIRASNELISAFTAMSTKVACPEDHVLFQKGEQVSCVYLVEAGEVGLLLPVSSTHAFAFRATRDLLVGLPAAFSDEPYSMTAVAWKGAELGVMSSEKFCKMIASNAGLSIDVLRILAAETRAARAAMVAHLSDI